MEGGRGRPWCSLPRPSSYIEDEDVTVVVEDVIVPESDIAVPDIAVPLSIGVAEVTSTDVSVVVEVSDGLEQAATARHAAAMAAAA